jgi:hypothetical protein
VTGLATGQYLIIDRNIVYKRFFFWEKSYDLSELNWIEMPKIINRFDYLPGFNSTILHFKNNKKLDVSWLPNPNQFRETIDIVLNDMKASA